MKKRWSNVSLVLALVAGMLLAPAMIALLAATGGLPSDGLSDPPVWESRLGQRALAASLERRAEGLRNPIAANDEAALLAGMSLYRNNCAGCHGGLRERSAWGSRGFYPRVPQFWQDPVAITPEQAYAAIHGGIRYSGMGAWRDLISEPEMWQVANFVSRMHDLPPRVDPRWRAPPQPSGQ